MFEKYLPQLVASLPTDYALRVRNFLTEYLGTPDQPVPFGGRDADFSSLNAWLHDPLASPYLLLAAPAGRGKSSLLARWSVQLLATEDVSVVFFPVSIRFRTNLSSVVFAAIASRLAALHGGKIPSGLDTPAEMWRGAMLDYLTRPLPEGKRLVFILDGIDEAADWEPGPDLFPLAPPKGLRIVLSARYRAGDVDATSWLRSLGWDRPGLALAQTLSPLTPDGVADVLQHMGFPLDRLGKRVDIVAELHRLSEGDPLLVRLYVNDLWARGEVATHLSPEDLRAIRPGLEGYFDRWWDDQRRLWETTQTRQHEPAVYALLSLLSCALGPLKQEDVLNLAPPEVGLNTFVLENILDFLKRFVIGDGRQLGYVFSHPRLGTYFFERLAAQERRQWEERFLVWGKETLQALNNGNLPPREASSYIVQYYGGHLERSNQGSSEVLALAGKGWKQAWEVVENSYSGFLNDVDRAWRAAERADTRAIQAGVSAPYVALTVRCALCHASVHSLAGNIPPSLIEQLVAKKVWSVSQGFTYACHISNPKQQAEAISRLAPHLPEPLLYEALEIIRGNSHLSSQTEALIALLPYLPERPKEEASQRALKQILSLKNEYMQAGGIMTLAAHLPLSLLQEARQKARLLKDPFSRSHRMSGKGRYCMKRWNQPRGLMTTLKL